MESRKAPLITAHLFPLLHGKLSELLRSLDADDWAAPTVAPAWTVKDVAAHLLDTQQRQLSRLRGEPQPAPAIASNADLVAYINRLNDEGVRRYRTLDSRELIALMEEGAAACAAHYASLDPFGDAVFGVSWAGEERSPNWFHVARELTERWHHQQQIRMAVGKPGIMTPELYYPVLDCFMRALPFTYDGVVRPAGTVVRVTVEGECGGGWHLRRDAEHWRLVASPAVPPAAAIAIPQEIAWLIFTKGLRREHAEPQVRSSGDAVLARHVLGMLAIVG